jgi:FkbM family methyltransferase
MINFIQIGANIGNTDTDYIWKVVRDKKWNGVFIEPIPSSFTQLVNNYSDLEGSYFEDIAISDFDGEIIMYSRSNSETSNQQSSVNKNHWGSDTETTVKCLTLNSLVDKYGLTEKSFDLLQIDAEGHDGKILLATDFNKVRPNKIRFEIVHMYRKNRPHYDMVMKYLIDNGYKQIVDEYEEFVKPTEKGFDVMFERLNK